MTVQAMVLLAGAAALPAPAGADEARATLTIEAQNFRSSQGRAAFSVFRQKDGFPAEPRKAHRVMAAPITAAGKARITLSLPPGVYAVSILHDENSNGRLDTDWLGRPREGLGASNNARGRRGPPRFEDARFEVKAPTTTIAIRMLYR